MKQFRYELIVTMLYSIFVIHVIKIIGFEDLTTTLFTLTIIFSLPMVYLGVKTARLTYYELKRLK